MILGFKEQFIEPIKRGSKIHTIREDKKQRWKPGNLIHFATGVRTPNYRQFHSGKCKGVQCIKIVYDNIPPCGNTISVSVDNRQLSITEVEEVARNDGFESIDDFLNWFNRDFHGKIIHWTDKKY